MDNTNDNNALKLMQWNICGIRGRQHHLTAAAGIEEIDIFLLQETLLPEGANLALRGYQVSVLPQGENTRGLATLVKDKYTCNLINDPAYCGEGVETLAVEIQTRNTHITVYNIYRAPNKELVAGELLTTAAYEPVIIAGDFNAHHPDINRRRRTRNPTGTHLMDVLNATPEIALLNDSEPTHVLGGVLDLTFISTDLLPHATWKIHPTFTSDHFATVTQLQGLEARPALPPLPRWNLKKANWEVFKQAIEEWSNGYIPPQDGDVDKLEKDLVEAFHQALDQACPQARHGGRVYKDHWYYDDEVQEQYARVNTTRKLFRRNRTEENRLLLQAVVRLINQKIRSIRWEKWLEWCSTLNEHTNLSALWGQLHTATGKRRKKEPIHPAPEEEAERLAELFANRAATRQLPQAIQRAQQDAHQTRFEEISIAGQAVDIYDAPFTTEELIRVGKSGKDTAPGQDGITYTMISRTGVGGQRAVLNLINASWEEGKLPEDWKKATVQPIPKPKDPRNPRPIHLLSCLNKTAEKMVRNRIMHKIGPLHKHLYAYQKGTGTGDNLAAILGTIDGLPSAVVFLDLEKAFELANAEAILQRLVRKGVKRRLLRWVSDYLDGRQFCVRFQGLRSGFKHLENGTPQGGILSPLLFNLLMETLVQLELGHGCKLLCYADDLQLVVQGPNKVRKAQRALGLIEDQCTTLGLKINPQKTKAMAVKFPTPEEKLNIQGSDVDWVSHHQCLGVYFDRLLSFQKQVEYLKGRMASRVNVMRALTGLHAGADCDVLRLYYSHAVRSLVDYASPALVTLGEEQIQKLQVEQNKALRLMLGAPMWTRISNMQMETNIPPIEVRISKNVACLAAKTFRRPGDEATKRRILAALDQRDDLFQDNRWSRAAAKTIKSSGIRRYLTIGEDTASRDFVEPFPWTKRNVAYIFKAPDNDRDNQLARRIEAEVEIARHAEAGTAVYYTDGSVVPDTERCGAAFFHNGESFMWRTSDGCSSLQTELAAILQAGRHALTWPEPKIVVHTDSKSAIDVLQQQFQKDNINLITSTLAMLQAIQDQGKQVTLHWIPSHVGIAGNEEADDAAKAATNLQRVTMKIGPSLSKIKAMFKKKALTKIRDINRGLAAGGSPSCRWYRRVTGGTRLLLPRTTPREVRVNIHRLRLGYLCNWQLIRRIEPRNCKHCDQETGYPLLHWLLECRETEALRATANIPNTDPTELDARQTAMDMLRKIWEENPEVLQQAVRLSPPPR